MNALLGKIAKVRESTARRGTRRRLHRLDVSFKPACVMPARKAVPAWLKDQTLTVARTVADPREVGGVGDSIVLTPAESADWLFPLRIEPPVARGRVPARLEVSLRWWKNKKPGELTVRAGGRRRTARFTKRRTLFAASVATRGLVAPEASLPLDVEVSFEKMTLACTVLPAGRPCHHKLVTRDGERHRLEGPWLGLDVCPGVAGGGISMLREAGRGCDHFRHDDGLICGPLDHGGHRDRVRLGWPDKLADVAMTSAAARRDGEATRLCLEGTVDEGRAIHTTAAYTLYDRMPLLLLQRDVLRHKAKKPDDKKGDKKNGQVAPEPVDEMARLELGFRAAFRTDAARPWDGRVLSVDDGRFAALRHAQLHDFMWRGWRLTDGWVVVEHPGRRECLMYLFDPHNAPWLHTGRADSAVTLEPDWPSQPLRPQSGAGFALALTAGERCGADAGGAWVACRRPAADGGVACAVVARFREPPTDRAADVRLGRQNVRAPLDCLALPGVGTVWLATAVLPKARMTSTLHVAAGGIPARSLT